MCPFMQRQSIETTFDQYLEGRRYWPVTDNDCVLNLVVIKILTKMVNNGRYVPSSRT